MGNSQSRNTLGGTQGVAMMKNPRFENSHLTRPIAGFGEPSSPLSALLRVCSVSPKGPGGRRGIKYVAPGVSESGSNTPPGGIKEILGPGESRDQRSFQRGSGRGGYGGKESGGAQELMNSEKTRYEDWEGKIHCGGGHLRNVYEFGDVVSGGDLCGGIEEPGGERTARAGQAATCNITMQSLHESLGMTGSERLGIEYLEGRTLQGLLGADIEAYVEEEPEDPLEDMSPEITDWDWTDNDLEDSERMQGLHEGFDITETKRVRRFEAQNGYKEGQNRVYGHEMTEDDARLYSLLGSANASPGAFERRFWRPNLRG